MHTNIEITDNTQFHKLASFGFGAVFLVVLMAVDGIYSLSFINMSGLLALDLILAAISILVLYGIVTHHSYGVFLGEDEIRFHRMIGMKSVRWAELKSLARGNFGQSYKLNFCGGFIYLSTSMKNVHQILNTIREHRPELTSSEW